MVVMCGFLEILNIGLVILFLVVSLVCLVFVLLCIEWNFKSWKGCLLRFVCCCWKSIGLGELNFMVRVMSRSSGERRRRRIVVVVKLKSCLSMRWFEGVFWVL